MVQVEEDQLHQLVDLYLEQQELLIQEVVEVEEHIEILHQKLQELEQLEVRV